MSTSDEAYAVIDAAADELRALGFEGPAPWRLLAWSSFDRLRDEQCAREDLARLREMLDAHLRELDEEVR